MIEKSKGGKMAIWARSSEQECVKRLSHGDSNRNRSRATSYW